MNAAVRSFLVDGARPKKTPFRRMSLDELNTGARHTRGEQSLFAQLAR